MLSETDRNREMCNQIVRRVFIDPVQANADQSVCPVGRLVSSTVGRVYDWTVLLYLLFNISDVWRTGVSLLRIPTLTEVFAILCYSQRLIDESFLIPIGENWYENRYCCLLKNTPHKTTIVYFQERKTTTIQYKVVSHGGQPFQLQRVWIDTIDVYKKNTFPKKRLKRGNSSK